MVRADFREGQVRQVTFATVLNTSLKLFSSRRGARLPHGAKWSESASKLELYRRKCVGIKTGGGGTTLEGDGKVPQATASGTVPLTPSPPVSGPSNGPRGPAPLVPRVVQMKRIPNRYR